MGDTRTQNSNPTDRQRMEELIKNPEASLTLQLVSINGVIGLLGVTEMFGGNVVTGEFKPLTPELIKQAGIAESLELAAKKAGIADDYAKLLATQEVKAKNLVKSGKLQDLTWISKHIDIDMLKHEPQAKRFSGAFFDMLKHDEENVARVFTDDRNLMVRFEELADGVEGIANRNRNLIRFNTKTYAVSDEWVACAWDKDTSWHEVGHLQSHVPPDLNANQSALYGAILDETSANWNAESMHWKKARNMIKTAPIENVTHLLDGLHIPQKYHQINYQDKH